MATSENGDRQKTIAEIIAEWTPVEEALDRAFYRAVLLHREANVPMTFADEDGKPYQQDAHEIPIPEKYAGLEPFRY
jgi:hypothetical protein